MMRKFNTIILFCFATFVLYAQAPNTFRYQAIARNENGEPIINKEISIRIRILEGLISETNIYTEVHEVRSNAYGLINLSIGEGDVVNGDLNTLKWGENNFLIEVGIADPGESEFQILGRAQLVSVPYALYANKAGNVFSGDYNDLTNKPDLTDTSSYIKNEQDPVFAKSVAAVMSAEDTVKWNNKSDFSGDYSDLSNAPDLSDTSKYLKSENDPVFTTSIAAQITGGDTTRWNNKSDFNGNYNNLINTPDLSDTANYLKTESDPLYISSIAAGITSADTNRWNNTGSFSGDYNDLLNLPDLGDTAIYLKGETDPVFLSSVAQGITAVDTNKWNNKLDVEVDGSVTNEMQDISLDGDTLSISGGSSVVLPFMDSIWKKNGNNVYFNDGFVGISAYANNAELHIGGLSRVRLERSDGSWNRTPFKFLITGNNGYAGLRFDSSSDYGLTWTFPLFIEADSNFIGIGTVEPNAKIEIENGDVYINTITKGVIMKSPDGQCWRFTPDNSGNLNGTSITCPED